MLLFGGDYKDKKAENHSGYLGSQDRHWFSASANSSPHKKNRGACFTFEKARPRQSLPQGTSKNGFRAPEAYEIFGKKESKRIQRSYEKAWDEKESCLIFILSVVTFIF